MSNYKLTETSVSFTCVVSNETREWTYTEIKTGGEGGREKQLPI